MNWMVLVASDHCNDMVEMAEEHGALLLALEHRCVVHASVCRMAAHFSCADSTAHRLPTTTIPARICVS